MPGTTPTATAIPARIPAGWRHPKPLPRTSRSNAASAAAAPTRYAQRHRDEKHANLGQRAGDGAMVAEQRRATPKATTRAADRIAQVSRHARASRRAATSGRYSTRASTPNVWSPSPKLAISMRPRPAGPAVGAGVIESHDHVVDHGRLSRNPSPAETAVAPAIQSAVLHEAAASNVATASTMPTATSNTTTTGAKAPAAPASRPPMAM